MYGDDWEYANSRLNGTIVRLKEEPVFVHNIGRGMKAEVSTLEDVYTAFFADAHDLDLVPVPLGMCNFDGVAAYLSRVPLRRDWRQGLRRENFISSVGDHAKIPPNILAKVIKGVYPTLKECLEKVKGEDASAAWCRHWAVTSHEKLVYKRSIVGTSAGGILLLDKQFSYLAEALEEAV